MKKILACAALMAWGLQGFCQEAKEENPTKGKIVDLGNLEGTSLSFDTIPGRTIIKPAIEFHEKINKNNELIRIEIIQGNETICNIQFFTKDSEDVNRVLWWNPFNKTFFITNAKEKLPRSFEECSPIIEEYIRSLECLKNSVYFNNDIDWYINLPAFYEDNPWNPTEERYVIDLLKEELLQKIPYTYVGEILAYNPYTQKTILSTFTNSANQEIAEGTSEWCLDQFILKKSQGKYESEMDLINALIANEKEANDLAKDMERTYNALIKLINKEQ